MNPFGAITFDSVAQLRLCATQGAVYSVAFILSPTPAFYFRTGTENTGAADDGGDNIRDIAGRTWTRGVPTSLESLSALGSAADKMAYTTGVKTWAETPITAFARTLLAASTKGAARTIIFGDYTPYNIEWAGADMTGATASDAAWDIAVATGRPIYIPKGTLTLTSSKALFSGMTVFGDGPGENDGTNGSVIQFTNCEGFAANDGSDFTDIVFCDLQIRNSSNWGGNTKTALLLSNVSYSRFERLKIMYFQYGIYGRRTNPGAGFGAAYFNIFNGIHTFGCQYGMVVADNGATCNAWTFNQCRAEDNGQRSGGYGLSIDGVGHRIDNFYAGLPNHTAGLHIGPAAMHLFASGIYGESPALTQVILDATGAGRDNVVIGVHSDGVPTLVTRSSSASNTVYIDAGSATNVRPEQSTVVSKTPGAVPNGSSDYQSFSVTGIAVGDNARVVTPAGWPNGLIRGEPTISADNVVLPYVNLSGGSLTPPSGNYTIYWQDRT